LVPVDEIMTYPN